MTGVRDRDNPGKKAVNVSIDAALLREARSLEINLSATLETALRRALSEERGRRWLDENAAAIDAYNAQVAEGGAFADALRDF